ncbi:SpoIIE family protein phosphatase [Roseomonas sp. HJA6]|uniref:SpoIIE family protein phosphatase n=1 Tax=Roseomonas alba TaxID=2846776 RepID=A0ABS7AF21_9PROT|nr:SpoIIE family protein phosphatase [Neoroseomonas alba]MBW6400911.1 SpoIIE family protein phosphatase [Neoroseomonas alba]
MTSDATERHPPEEERTMVRRAGPVAAAEPIVHLLDLEGTEGQPARRVAIGPVPLTIGRGAQAGLVLDSGDVSRSHCVIALEGEAAVVTDLGSTNGTIVDGRRIDGPTRLTPGARLTLGPVTLVYRSGRAADFARTEEVEKDLARAGRYVEALLPPPIPDGPVRAHWRFVPSTNIGGDGFGYGWLDQHRFAAWLLDVSGHGVGSALLAASVMNLLRVHSLPGTDFTDAAAVLAALNDRFQMDRQGGLYFTIWYGVFDPRTRILGFGCAGQHPGFLLVPGEAAPQALWVKNPPVGMMPDWPYRRAEVTVPPGSRLHLFSDGAFEIVTADGRELTIGDFLPLLTAAAMPGIAEPERLWRAVRTAARPGPLDDDVSLVALDFA